MQETEINLSDMLFAALRKWRGIIVFAIICAILAGAVTAVGRIIEMNDEKTVERWQAKYEAAYGSYWAEINDYDRQISENERLAAQAQTAIEELGRKEEDYKSDIGDLEAKIAYYEALIVDYQANIERLGREKETLTYYLTYREEQNENSIFMRIDPYNVNTYETYLRVDTGYEILPGNTYQNIDRTPEVLQTYRLLVSSADFYEAMISDLGLNTEVRYLTEVISVSVYNTSSLHISVMSDSAEWSRMVGSYIAQAILSSHGHVAQTVTDHTITEYNAHNYAVVDLSVYSRQAAYYEEELNYEDSIREVETAVLNIEADIREMNTEIRELGNEIEGIDAAIDIIPLDIQLHEDEIAQYMDANFDLKVAQLKLKEEPEPVYQGYTTLSVFTGFVKFAILGGVVGAVIAAVYFAIIGILGGKVLSAEQICLAIGAGFFGTWPKSAKKRFSFVDRWLAQWSGVVKKETTPEAAKELVLSNVSVACVGYSKVLLCGGADADAIETVAAAIRAELPNLKVVSGGVIGFDANVVRGMADCDAVVLVEQIDRSRLNAVMQMQDRVQSQGKSIVGIVTV